MAEASAPREERRNKTKLYNPYVLSEFEVIKSNKNNNSSSSSSNSNSSNNNDNNNNNNNNKNKNNNKDRKSVGEGKRDVGQEEDRGR